MSRRGYIAQCKAYGVKRKRAGRIPSRRSALTYYVLRFTLLCLALGLATSTQAQLISPGKLARAHADLEGIRNCTSCHSLGEQGIDNQKCLTCHTPLQNRVRAGQGFHARVSDQNCADCHKEHFGADFELVRLNEREFNHNRTGFRLTGAHTNVDCRSCHQPEFIVATDVRRFKGEHGTLNRTYLGLGTTCQTCHEADTPHAGQFEGEDCATCHATDAWEEASGFDHDQARFKLTGRHQQVDCASCHPQATADGETFMQFEGLSFANCSSCHDDAHNGAFGGNCANCHNPGGWQQIRNFDEDRFNHSATGFDLEGRHATLDCAACHARPARNDGTIQLTFVRGTGQHTYPRIRVDDCLSCHTDYHDDTFAETPGGTRCTNCHTQEGWFPTTYSLERHNEATRFPLTGAHLATPCSACHHTEDEAVLTFAFAELTCESCHAPDNPHGDQFADEQGTTACADCHITDGWTRGVDFDHDETDFPLTGLHTTVDCESCHTTLSDAAGRDVQQFRGLATDCESCHAPDDPHQGQFADQSCESCHTTDGFAQAGETFDHSQTRFPLIGAHQNALCGQCHRTETAPDGSAFVRFRPLSTACRDCHSGG